MIQRKDNTAREGQGTGSSEWVSGCVQQGQREPEPSDLYTQVPVWKVSFLDEDRHDGHIMPARRRERGERIAFSGFALPAPQTGQHSRMDRTVL